MADDTELDQLVTFRLSQSDLERLDKMADMTSRNRSDLLRLFVREGLANGAEIAAPTGKEGGQ